MLNKAHIPHCIEFSSTHVMVIMFAVTTSSAICSKTVCLFSKHPTRESDKLEHYLQLGTQLKSYQLK